jgi:TetR/AcrR family transcriptional regulator, lmrAB and yxaGH operons repressor
MIGHTAALIEERGPSGFGINEVLRESGTPRGSLYFHFPGGKDELVEAALRHGAAEIEDLIGAAVEAGGSVVEVLDRVLDGLARRQSDAEFLRGCPVASVALDSTPDSPLGEVCADLYSSWKTALAELLRADGHRNADALATQILALAEGALLLGRVRRSRAPMDAAADAVRVLLERS